MRRRPVRPFTSPICSSRASPPVSRIHNRRVVPTGTAARERRSFPPGLEFEGVAVEGTRARFRAHAPVRLDPWRVEDARLAWSTERGSRSRSCLPPSRDERASCCRPSPPSAAHRRRAAKRAHAPVVDRGTRRRDRARLGRAHCRGPPLGAPPLGPARLRSAPSRRAARASWLRLVRELLILPTKFAFLEIEGDRAPRRPQPAAHPAPPVRDAAAGLGPSDARVVPHELLPRVEHLRHDDGPLAGRARAPFARAAPAGYPPRTPRSTGCAV